MATHVAFLRGMNLGKRRIKNPELVAAVAALGFHEVVAYQASGNVLFTSERDPGDAERVLAEGLEKALGYPVRTFVRTADEVRALAARRPFADLDDADQGKPQVTLLARAPSRAEADAAEALATAEDAVLVAGREWFWLPRKGISGTTLDLRAVERTLGTGTTRTLGTVQRIARKL